MFAMPAVWQRSENNRLQRMARAQKDHLYQLIDWDAMARISFSVASFMVAIWILSLAPFGRWFDQDTAPPTFAPHSADIWSAAIMMALAICTLFTLPEVRRSEKKRT